MSIQPTSSEPLEFKFVTARPSLQKLFPFDPNYDIEITFHKNKYELRLAYLKLESDFFKKNNKLGEMLEIKEDFDEEQFDSLLKCFYGGTYKCPRNQVFSLWAILEHFRIGIFKKIIINDMKANSGKYNIFELLTFEVFNLCLIILDQASFTQLKQSRQILMDCPLDVFKFIINTHNRSPNSKKCLNYFEIDALLCEYCEKHDFSPDFQKEIKFELIEKTDLTSEEYNYIFLGGAKSHSAKQIPSSFSENYDSDRQSTSGHHHQTKGQPSQSQKGKDKLFVNESTQLLLLPNKSTVNKDEMQHWKSKLEELKVEFEKNHFEFHSMNSSVTSLSNSLRKSAENSKENDSKLSKFEKRVREIEDVINQKSQSLRKIEDRVLKLESATSNKKGSNSKAMKQIEKQEEEDHFVESHIIPGFVLGDMLTPPKSPYEPTASTANFSKKKKSVYESNRSDENVDFSYRNSLIFDREPTSVPKKYLSNLAKFLEDDDQFMKKKELTLLFRRQSKGQNVGDPDVIRKRNGLLVLFETDSGQHAGGYISVELPSHNKAQSLCDSHAFIFSLSSNAKFSISKGQEKQAVALSKHYLVSFANDLMISLNCLSEESYSEWPNLYEGGKRVSQKSLTVKDLVGGNEFRVNRIEIYQVKSQEVQMIV